MNVVVVALTTNSDIGHVDFLEMVYKQAERPYVIVGLHFDQVQLLPDVYAHSHLSNNNYTFKCNASVVFKRNIWKLSTSLLTLSSVNVNMW